jgi:hypothetical protein
LHPTITNPRRKKMLNIVEKKREKKSGRKEGRVASSL